MKKDMPYEISHEQLEKRYNNKIIRKKNRSIDVLEGVNSEYGLTLIENFNEIDYAGQSRIKEFSYLLNDGKEPQGKDYSFKVYKLKKNLLTKKYYHYYHERFGKDLNVYVYHELKTDKLFSNCDLLDLKLVVLGG